MGFELACVWLILSFMAALWLIGVIVRRLRREHLPRPSQVVAKRSQRREISRIALSARSYLSVDRRHDGGGNFVEVA